MWIKWAFFEGLTKTINKILCKFVAKGNTLAGAFLVTLVIGAVQMTGGLLIALFRKEKLFTSLPKIFGSIIFGVIASIMTVLIVYTFTIEGADIGIATFLIMLSIVPGAIIDKKFFFEHISRRKLIGIILYIITGFVFLIDFKTQNLFFIFQKWMWPPLVIALLLAINEGITRKISSKIQPFANNFWIGLTTIVVSSFGLLFLNSFANIKIIPVKFWLVTVVMGLIVVLMISCKLLAYKAGGNIATKQLIMQGTYLIAANFLGWLIYKEVWTMGKTIGLPLFFIAFFVAHKEVWEYIKMKFIKNQTV